MALFQKLSSSALPKLSPLSGLGSVRTHVGYMPFEGPFKPADTERQRLSDAILSVNLKPITRIKYTWDPMHPRVQSVRKVMFYLSSEKVRNTNPAVFAKTEVVNDRSEPMAQYDLVDGRRLVFKTAYLTPLEVIGTINKYALPLVKEDKAPAAESKGAGKIGKKR